jgi:hypothetical protein
MDLRFHTALPLVSEKGAHYPQISRRWQAARQRREIVKSGDREVETPGDRKIVKSGDPQMALFPLPP